MVVITNNEIARAIYLSTEGKTGAELTKTSQNVTKFLARRRLLSKQKDILELLTKIIHKEEGTVMAKVSSVEKLNHKIKEDLIHLLKKRYSAKQIVLEEIQDGTLLGGFRIEVQDEVIDGSIKNKIGQLQEHLNRNI